MVGVPAAGGGGNSIETKIKFERSNYIGLGNLIFLYLGRECCVGSHLLERERWGRGMFLSIAR